ncbi:DUF6807 family protein [Bacteroidota bacterium]
MNYSSVSIFSLFLIICFSYACQVSDESHQTVKLLILSGRNNHDWEKTTPVLKRIFEKNGYYEVDVTNRPDTFNFEYLARYDVVLSNWNSWPENDLRWPETMEEGLLQFVKEGGGLVFFHASTSVFYEWPEFRNISTGAWEENTHHGKRSSVKITIENHDHPITKGLSDFYIFDEIWVDAGQNEAFEVLGTASGQPAIFAGNYGNGRIFHTIPGHDTRSMHNTGFQNLILRGTQWAAKAESNLPLPQEMHTDEGTAEPEYSWFESDTTFGLFNNEKVTWQFNYNTIWGKPFFHPVYLNRNRITCLGPDDHLWHLGQWFSWKFINGVNYWEYIGKTYKSAGITEIESVEFNRFPDFSAEITLNIIYHPVKGEEVLEEKRIIHISPPGDDRIWMDYDIVFKPIEDSVILDRTPIMGEPEGKSWGGYGGLSIRFNQDFTESRWISMNDKDTIALGSTGDWLYMGFQGLDGSRIGSAMFISNATKRDGAAWYLTNDTETPFYYFSPAYLYYKPLILNKGETLRLNYRLLHMAGDVSKEMLVSAYEDYLKTVER